MLLRGSQYVVYTCNARLSNSKCESFIDAWSGYPRSEGSGAKFEVYLGIAAAARALIYRRNFVTTLSVSLWSSLPLTGCRIIGLGLASAFKHTYTLQHNPTAATWLSTRAVYRCSTLRHAQRRLQARARNEHANNRAIVSVVRARSRYTRCLLSLQSGNCPGNLFSCEWDIQQELFIRVRL